VHTLVFIQLISEKRKKLKKNYFKISFDFYSLNVRRKKIIFFGNHLKSKL